MKTAKHLRNRSNKHVH